MAKQGDQSPPIEIQEGESVDAKCLREVSETGTTSQGAPEPSEANQERIMTFWTSTRPKEEVGYKEQIKI